MNTIFSAQGLVKSHCINIDTTEYINTVFEIMDDYEHCEATKICKYFYKDEDGDLYLNIYFNKNCSRQNMLHILKWYTPKDYTNTTATTGIGLKFNFMKLRCPLRIISKTNDDNMYLYAEQDEGEIYKNRETIVMSESKFNNKIETEWTDFPKTKKAKQIPNDIIDIMNKNEKFKTRFLMCFGPIKDESIINEYIDENKYNLIKDKLSIKYSTNIYNNNVEFYIKNDYYDKEFHIIQEFDVIGIKENNRTNLLEAYICYNPETKKYYVKIDDDKIYECKGTLQSQYREKPTKINDNLQELIYVKTYTIKESYYKNNIKKKYPKELSRFTGLYIQIGDFLTNCESVTEGIIKPQPPGRNRFRMICKTLNNEGKKLLRIKPIKADTEPSNDLFKILRSIKSLYRSGFKNNEFVLDNAQIYVNSTNTKKRLSNSKKEDRGGIYLIRMGTNFYKIGSYLIKTKKNRLQTYEQPKTQKIISNKYSVKIYKYPITLWHRKGIKKITTEEENMLNFLNDSDNFETSEAKNGKIINEYFKTDNIQILIDELNRRYICHETPNSTNFASLGSLTKQNTIIIEEDIV